jgi:hypothetical protein
MKEFLNHWVIVWRELDTRYFDVECILYNGYNVYKLGGAKLNEMNECHSDYIFYECDVKNKVMTGRTLEFKELKRLHKIKGL